MYAIRSYYGQDIMYRLKMFDNRNEFSFSKTLVFRSAGGSGNDVIAKKSISGTWVLLEAGAGTRGAGIILRLDPARNNFV